MVREERLSGGFINEVVRVGNTVRRAGSQASDIAHRVLRLFEERGWDGAPRYLGTDSQGRDTLDYIDGTVPTSVVVPEAYKADVSLAAVARLVREFHDLTAGSDLARDKEVVCHNDLSPRNTVYREKDGIPIPVAFIDWDIAGPGPRIHDVAHMCWQYLDLGPGVADIRECGRQLRLLCDAYGLDDRTCLLDTIIWWMDETSSGIEHGADEGIMAMIRLRDAGAPQEVRGRAAWVREHRADLEGAL